ncbi:MAG: DUF2304 domain-containing protein [Clostridia bacterium]|nr:DUF2304 domain-containing protein [Clostridia bacterium]
MSINLTIAVAIIFVLMMLSIINKVRKGKLQLSYSVFWILSGITLIIILLIPNCISNITNLLGFEVASNMIFFITIVMAFYLILQLMTELSKEAKRNVNLIQEISILKKKMTDIEKEIKTNKNK